MADFDLVEKKQKVEGWIGVRGEEKGQKIFYKTTPTVCTKEYIVQAYPDYIPVKVEFEV